MISDRPWSIAVGGLTWTVSAPPGALDLSLFGPYVVKTESGAPSIFVQSDPSLDGECHTEDRVFSVPGGLAYEGQQARWSADESATHVYARVGSDRLAAQRALVAWMSTRLVMNGALLLHGAAVRAGQQAVLLLGPPKTGKSTAARLLAGRVMCADSLVLRAGSTGCDVYPAPFRAAHDAIPDLSGPLPLGAVYVLKQSPKAKSPGPISSTSHKLAILTRAIVAQYPRELSWSQRVIAVMSSVLQVPFFAVQFTLHDIQIPDRVSASTGASL